MTKPRLLQVFSLLGLVMGLSACQARPLAQVMTVPRQAPVQRLVAQSQSSSGAVTAKQAFTEAEQVARKWSADAALTHLEGRAITSQGLPHQRYGEWRFAFIDYQNPQKALLVILSSGKPVRTQTLSAQQLPQSEPLEDRAWGYDSDRLISKIREHFPTVTLPLSRIELTQLDRRLVWALGPGQSIDAMSGQPFTP